MMTRTLTTLLMATLALGATSAQASDDNTTRQTSRPVVATTPGTDLNQQARLARTATEHATVARQFRQRADSLSQELDAVDADLKKAAGQPRTGMRYKWPALDPDPSASLRQKAMELRRAHAEAQRAAAHHTQLAVEQGFSAE